MKTTKTISALIIACALIFSSCKKEVGPQGPAGSNGNANVQAQTFYAQQFTYNSAKAKYEMYITDFQITQTVLDKGLVVAYINLFTSSGSYPGMAQLPIASLQMDVSFGLNTALIQTPNSTVQGYMQSVKIVVIPGRIIKPNVNYANYNEVKKAYNL